jgi:multisubunit Na+/H+ antiporter MnhB subunit
MARCLLAKGRGLTSFLVPGAGVVLLRFTYYREAQRNARYNLLLMSLMILMSWTVFWLQPDNAARIGISTASIFPYAIARWGYVGLFDLVATITMTLYKE